ncbi:NAD(P)H-dependent oxidoreductase [Paenibacillus sp. 1P07SE]|uniref:NAD(P)H-dependent oxidoreductase n=1 Tax=Paenibacillus sp. 1P07SE TaxID=3132209 RepID=UPI0039A5B4C1
MHTLIIVVHPGLQGGSRVNRRLTELMLTAKGVTVHDLYACYPEGNIDVKREQELLLQHKRVVFQFPLWWYSAPPLLKHWLDEVLTFGWAYGPGGDRLHGQEWRVAVTAGSPAASYGGEGYNKYTLEEMLRPFEATANLVGARWLPLFAVCDALQLSEGELTAAALQYGEEVLADIAGSY